MNSSPVVSVDWLQEQLKNGLTSMTIVDCRFSLLQPEVGKQQYQASHIPGAYYLDLNQDLSSPVQRHGGRHPLPDAQTLTHRLNQMGVYSMDTPQPTWVIAYDDSRLAYAARLWWLLRYLGHDRVAVLDGGWQAWRAAGYPTTAQVPEARAGQFNLALRPNLVVDRQMVLSRQNQPGTILIDSREPERYRGEREPIDPIAGHIPGAINAPWQAVFNSEGLLQPLEWHQQYWQSVATATELIVYCGSGVTACVNLLSLELAQINWAKLYAGSWSDWCSYQI